MSLLLLLLACSGTKTDDTSGTVDTSTTDTSVDSGDSGGDTAPACSVITPGDDWAWSGECPQMTTPVAITVDGCSLTLDYESVGGMTMGMPFSATVDGDTVTFADDDSVTGCVGTVASADRIDGSCDGGCTFKLKR
jgi:hypothetical protein